MRRQAELRDNCNDVPEVLDNYLIPNAAHQESEVFNLKMKGDDFRCPSEVASGDSEQTTVAKSRQAYQETFEVNKKEMELPHPVQLGLA